MSLVWHPIDLKPAIRALLTGALKADKGKPFIELFPRTHYGWTSGDGCLALFWSGREAGSCSTSEMLEPNVLWSISSNSDGPYDPKRFYCYRLYGCSADDL